MVWSWIMGEKEGTSEEYIMQLIKYASTKFD